MGFDFYFAGTQHETGEKLIVDLNANFLRSYHNDKKHIAKLIELKKEGKWKGKLMVDSGAFTCWTKGIEICPDTYIEWINENSEYVDYFIQLDSIPGKPNNPPTLEQAKQATEQSWQNYVHMVENVTCPQKILPVYHKDEPASYLQQIVNYKINGKPIEYMCLGGQVTVRSQTERQKWYNYIFDNVQRSSNPNIKIHSLGCANTGILERYPFYSSDATSWIMVGSVGNIITDYGCICVSDNKANEFDHIDNLPADAKQHILDECKEWGIDFEYLKESYRARSMFNIQYLNRWATNYEYKGLNSFKRNTLF